jgi:hypothetical protein
MGFEVEGAGSQSDRIILTVTQHYVALKADKAPDLVGHMAVIHEPPVMLLGTIDGTSAALTDVTLLLSHSLVVVRGQAVISPQLGCPGSL